MLDENTNWFGLARDADECAVDIGWIIHEEFYYGPPHPKTQAELEEFESKRIKISRPPIAVGCYILSADAIRAPGQLIDHYYRIISLCREFGQPLEHQSFWMRPAIWKDGAGITFSWLDTYQETLNWVQSMCRNDDGQLFHDIDQGWEVAFYGQGEFIFGAQSGGPEAPHEIEAFRFTRTKLHEKVKSAAERTAILVNKLNTQLGIELFKRF